MDCDQTQSLCRQLNFKFPSLTTFPNTHVQYFVSAVSTTKVNRYIGFNFYYTEVEGNCLLWLSNSYHRKPETAPDTGHQLIIVLIVPSAAHHNGAIICFTWPHSTATTFSREPFWHMNGPPQPAALPHTLPGLRSVMQTIVIAVAILLYWLFFKSQTFCDSLN